MLHAWFVEQQIGGEGGGGNFKRILLNECQVSFEENLKPVANVQSLQAHDRQQVEKLHKRRMLGNIIFVGALLERKMLASRILISVVGELVVEPTAASLECLAVFL